MRRLFKYIGLGVFSLALVACGSDGKQENITQSTKDSQKTVVQPPQFNADSAYSYVEAQVAFGPRVPNTPAHQKAQRYLENFMRQHTEHVILQPLRLQAYDGTILNGNNIIAQFQPEKAKRVLLAAHWDSRPFADQETDAKHHHSPIDGANDGASGVAVLMELARIMNQKAPNVGVDIVFFDLEDYGVPEFEDYSDNESWAMGSRYWANNPVPEAYTANFGILLDMVGGKNLEFRVEAYSKYYAPSIVKKVWFKAQDIGYGSVFSFEDGGVVMDDHIAVNEVMGIPMIDIIQYDASTTSSFFPHWHTLGDNIDNIEKSSLKIIGETVTHIIYNE